MQSPLSGLCEVLKSVQNCAKTFPGQLTASEAVTRAALVDPILRALGWDVADPGMVAVERSINTSGKKDILDYHLITQTDNPIIVEAKKLGAPLDEHFEQIVGYIYRANALHFFITDGLIWLHYTNFSQSNKAPVERIDLNKASEAELVKFAAYFINTLDAAQYIPEQQVMDDKLLDKIDLLERKFAALEQKFVGFSSGMPVSADHPVDEVSLPWLLLDGDWDATGRKPTHLRLPDGQVVDVRKWGQLLTETCKYCLANNPTLLEQLPIPDKAGRATKLMSLFKPPFAFDTFIIEDKTIYVCTNYSANTAVANADYMFGKLGNTAVKPALLLAE